MKKSQAPRYSLAEAKNGIKILKDDTVLQLILMDNLTFTNVI